MLVSKIERNAGLLCCVTTVQKAETLAVNLIGPNRLPYIIVQKTQEFKKREKRGKNRQKQKFVGSRGGRTLDFDVISITL